MEPFSDLITQWEHTLATADPPVAAATRRRYASVIRTFIAWYEQHTREPFTLAHLTPIDCTAYALMLKETARPSTVNVHVYALRAFGSWLTDVGRLDANPAAGLTGVTRSQELAPRALNAPQIHALLRSAQHTRHPQRDYAMVQMLLQTGMRVGECTVLRVGDIQFGERQGQVTIRAGKGNKARMVPLNRSARQSLASYLSHRWSVEPTIAAVAAHWPQVKATEPLWISQKGGMLSVRAIGFILNGVIADAMQRDLVPRGTTAHTLRHTFATGYLHDHPGDLVGLATLLGHRSIETTRIYVQPGEEELARRVEATHLNAYG